MKKLIFAILILASTVFGSGNFEISEGDVKILSPDGTSTIYFFGNSGLGQFLNIVDTSLTGTSVYADGAGLLTSTAPTTGTIGFWTRTEAPNLLTTFVAGDGILTTGTITGGTFTDGTATLTSGDITGLTSIQWDLTTVDTPAEGLMYWNDDDGTVNIGMPGGNVNLQIGQELNKRVRNVTGSTILNGTPVYISGSSGTKLTIAPGDATFAAGIAFRTYAVATEDILHNSDGYVTKLGTVRDIDLSTFAAGVPLYLAVGGAGAVANYYTTTPPTAPDVTVLVGIVEVATASGEMDVRITSVPNLNSLSDVQGSVADNDILQWDAATSTWDNTLTPSGLTSISATTITDTVATLTGGNLTGMGNITGSDVDITAGTGAIIGGSLGVTSEYTLPLVDGGTDGDIIKTDALGTTTWVTPTVDVPLVISLYDSKPARASEDNWNGGIRILDNAAAVNSGAPFAMTTKGSGKVLIVINAGGDMVGDITLTGTSVDRDDQSQTGSDTSVITLTGVTTDGTVADDGNGNTVHLYTKAYISDKWFTGVVTITTADTAITDMDIYHLSFEQLNDSPMLVLDTFDINLFTSGGSPEFDAYLYTIHVTGDECDIHNEAKLNIGTGTYATQPTTATNSYFRLRQGNIADPLDGTTDGFWADIHYDNPANIEDVTAKVWFTETVPLTLN